MTNFIALILAAIMPLCSTMAPMEPIEPFEPLPQGIAYIETEPLYGETEITALAKLMWGEAQGIERDTEKAAIAWTVLNRYDAGMGKSIIDVLTSPNQFYYRESFPVREDLVELAADVLSRWERERKGETDVGRVLPSEYMWYRGDGSHNHFRNAYKGGNVWDWTLESPYET